MTKRRQGRDFATMLGELADGHNTRKTFPVQVDNRNAFWKGTLTPTVQGALNGNDAYAIEYTLRVSR